jgi:hypothetical protein
VAAIVGGVVGGVLLVLLGILLYRKNKYCRVHRRVGSLEQNRSQATPFIYAYDDPTRQMGQPLNPVGRNAARTRQSEDVPASRPMDSEVQVHQDTNTQGIIELPPAYRDLPFPTSAPLGPL